MPIRWAVGVTTAPRSPATLTDTLLSLGDAGWFSAMVFADQKMYRGPFRNLLQAAIELGLAFPEANVYLITQDDVQMTAGLRYHLECSKAFSRLVLSDGAEVSRMRPGVLSLYCAAPNEDSDALRSFAAGDFKQGWHHIDDVPHQAFGALAYIFTRGSLGAFIGWGAKCPTPKAPADWLVGCFCHDNQLAYLSHSPSFVRHTGLVSSLPNPGGVETCRQCNEFIIRLPQS